VPFLLDSNVCIRLLNGTSPVLASRLAQHTPREIRVSTIVKAELLFGARHSERVESNLRLLRAFFGAFDSVAFDDLGAEHHGRVRAELARAGQLIGPNDLLIAASALAHDLVLVTHNVGEFSRVAGLRWEDWEA
jgi:tRNA(fMet)-specific endonuclease VapC